MDARTCDECGAVGLEPYDGWLRVEHTLDLPAFGGLVHTTFDSCSFECLIKAAEKERVKAAAP